MRHLPLLLLLVLCAQDHSGLTEGEKAAFRRITKEWMGLARTAVSKKLKAQALDCVARAEALDPGAAGLKGLKEKVEACRDEPREKDLRKWERRAASVRGRIAGLYESLYRSGATAEDAKVRERFEGYLFKAVGLAPDRSRWNQLLGLLKTPEQVRRALALDPPDNVVAKLKALLDRAAIDGVVLKQASTHPMKFYFSLPKAFDRTAKRRWPVLVCTDGAGSNFKGMGQGYHKARGDLPFIVVSPCSFSNTNKIEGKMRDKYLAVYCEEVVDQGTRGRVNWDEEGLLAFLKDLQKEYNAEDRIYVTGFSGGGLLTYTMIFRHPDLIAGAAPSAANFSNYGFRKGDVTKEDRTFPIHLITGEKDPHREWTHGKVGGVPGIEPQTDRAEKLLNSLGYPHVKRTMVPGMGHSSGRKHVLDTFRPYMKGKKKRSDPLN